MRTCYFYAITAACCLVTMVLILWSEKLTNLTSSCLFFSNRECNERKSKGISHEPVILFDNLETNRNAASLPPLNRKSMNHQKTKSQKDADSTKRNSGKDADSTNRNSEKDADSTKRNSGKDADSTNRNSEKDADSTKRNSGKDADSTKRNSEKDAIYKGGKEDNVYESHRKDSVLNNEKKDVSGKKDKANGSGKKDNTYGRSTKVTVYINDGKNNVDENGKKNKVYDGDKKDSNYENDKNHGTKDKVHANDGKDDVYENDKKDKVYINGTKDKVRANDGKDDAYENDKKDKVYVNGTKDKVRANDGKDDVYENDKKDKVYINGTKDKVRANDQKDDVYENDKKDKVYVNGTKDKVRSNDGKGEEKGKEVKVYRGDGVKRTVHQGGKRRYLIYQCDETSTCGGWGDRQRGMVSVFLLAIVTNRMFGINMTSPCDLKLFYIPNQVNWIVKKRDLKALSKIHVYGMDRNKNLYNLPTLDFNKRFPQDVVYLHTNIDYFWAIVKNPVFSKHLPKWVAYGRNKAFRTAWNMMMKYTAHFEEHVDNLMSLTSGGDLLCAHVRLRRNPTIPNDAKSINSPATVKHLWKFLDKYVTNSSRVFIATDSLEVRKMSKEYYKGRQLDSGGIILHIDRQRKWSQACEGFEMALLDQAILTQCSVLVSSASMFSQRAAMLSNTKDVFIFQNGTVSKLKV
ncbi:S-antigen protein-like isoform X2 [Gigantopelta aegis]|uniref:S-antigen protein-like isoform X2 n=1 Tax=Gigantopelta aegis TaxID=1735272 RepID=UPI001B8885FA|nr:S-antigen protein-like isoform X2 [Gigantopelta aegis]